MREHVQKILVKKNDRKGTFLAKNILKNVIFGLFTYQSTLSGDFGSLTCIILSLYMFYALYLHFLTLIGISGNILDLEGNFCQYFGY